MALNGDRRALVLLCVTQSRAINNENGIGNKTALRD